MDEAEKALTAYAKISELIRREDELINHRVTSGLSINGVIGTLVAFGYGAARDHLKDPKDFVILGIVIAALALLSLRVCYTTIRSLAAARTQNAYLKNYYNVHWRDKVEMHLDLPRPFGGFAYQDKDAQGNVIKEGAGGAGTLFIAIIGIWVLVLGMLIATSVKYLS